MKRIPCVLMRGGTSRGPMFLAEDLPTDPAERDRVLLGVMGSAPFRRVNGLAGMDPVTSKLAIVSRSSRPDADVDYLFAQADLESDRLDTSANCGNILSAVGPFAIDRGLFEASPGETCVRIHNINTGTIVHAVIKTPGGRVEYDGDTSIDGVPGTGAPISINFIDSVGSKTGRLFPTGSPVDLVDGIEVTCLDVAVPMVLIEARRLGKTGAEPPKELEQDREFMARLERIRLEAALKMGLGDRSGSVVPKIALVSRGSTPGVVRSRYFTPKTCHPSHAVTGAICVGTAAMIAGTSVAKTIGREVTGDRGVVVIEHPSGSLQTDIELAYNGSKGEYLVPRAALIRTAAPIFEGFVHVSGARP